MVISFNKRKPIHRKPIITGDKPVGNIRYSTGYSPDTNEFRMILEPLDYPTLWRMFINHILDWEEWLYTGEYLILMWMGDHLTQYSKDQYSVEYTSMQIARELSLRVRDVNNFLKTLQTLEWITPTKNGFSIHPQLVYPRLIQETPGWHMIYSHMHSLWIGYLVL